MPQLDSQTTVGQCVVDHPQTSRIFEVLQIDYCCGGETKLIDACNARSLDPQAVLGQLEQAVLGGNDPSGHDWQAATLTDLCDHIEQTHHEYLRDELPRLTELVAKVVNAHGDSHSELAEVQTAFGALRAELEPHMLKEEQILFPAIRLLEQSAKQPAFPFGTVANPVRMMEHEHDVAGNGLSRLRELTHDFAVPKGACNTYRAMLDGLSDLESNTHQHIHKENNILFPRAIELEAER